MGFEPEKSVAPDVDIEPGWRRVLAPPGDQSGGEAIVVIRESDPLPPGWREVE